MKAIKQQKKSPFSRLQRTVLLCVAVLVVTVAAVGTWIYFQDNLPPPHQVVTHSTKKPSEKPRPIATTKYDVDPDYPKAIYLPTVGAEGLIQRVGVDQHSRIAVPTNIHVAGWYVESVKPGEQGLSIISAHVDGPNEAGIFSRLANLTEGDEIIIEYGDGTEYRFTVRSTAQVPEIEAVDHLFVKNPDISRQLNLITCGGAFNAQAGTYDDRVIVVAEMDE